MTSIVAVVIVGLIAWWSIGVGGFVFWWTHDFDLTVSDTLEAAILGVFGPSTWLIGYFIHGNFNRQRIILRSRNR